MSDYPTTLEEAREHFPELSEATWQKHLRDLQQAEQDDGEHDGPA
mgnify:CR=1 FL=1